MYYISTFSENFEISLNAIVMVFYREMISMLSNVFTCLNKFIGIFDQIKEKFHSLKIIKFK